MTRQDLVGLTLEQLIRSFASSPECFDLEKAETSSFTSGPNDSILWKPRIESGGGIMTDPNNPSRTVIIVNNKATDTIQCFIYFKDMISTANALSHKADAQVECDIGFWSRFDPNWRKFQKLKKLIQANSASREDHAFLGKLHDVFPGCWDPFIFGKK